MELNQQNVLLCSSILMKAQRREATMLSMFLPEVGGGVCVQQDTRCLPPPWFRNPLVLLTL